MLRILVALVFIGAAAVLSWLSLTQDDFCLVCDKQADSSSLNPNTMQGALIKDLKLAAQEKELPAMWNQILEVRYVYHSKKVQKSLDKSPIVAINKKGNKRLLVEFYDEPDSEEFILVRYSVLDIASSNTVAEINRRLKLPSQSQNAAKPAVQGVKSPKK